MRVIATAGHVDHGKSSLVHRLTGMQPDRWEEERRRGLTIGLGFAWTRLADGQEVAFVDVPGHERFVPTMLAGVGPVPAVLFVVAADEGWMPQSDEHLAALDAFGVHHGLLVVTRADLADPTPALAEARAAMARTSLAGVRSVAVSSVTGAGVDELRAELSRLAGQLPEPDRDADVRLWVDRSFSVAGVGTVVTGTLAAGTLAVGDELCVASSGLRVRVRGLQTLERSRPEVAAVARVAVNLRGVARQQVGAGDALLTPERWVTRELVDVALGGARPRDLGRELMAHVGSAAVPVVLRPLGETTARLRLRRPLPLRVGDRILVRDAGQHRVAARADVLDVRPPGLRRRGAAAARGRTLDALAGGDVGVLTTAFLAEHGAVTGGEVRAMGLADGGHRVSGGWHADPATWDRWRQGLRDLVERWRRDQPLRPGVPTETARQELGLPDVTLVPVLAEETGLATADGVVHGRDDADLPADVLAAVAEVVAELADRPFVAPEAHRLVELGLGRAELAAAARHGLLLQVTDQVVLRPGADQAAARRLAELSEPFTVSAAKQALDTTRRVAVPLLELLDRHGLTVRLPDNRRRVVHESDRHG